MTGPWDCSTCGAPFDNQGRDTCDCAARQQEEDRAEEPEKPVVIDLMQALKDSLKGGAK